MIENKIIHQTVDEIMELYEKYGEEDYIGEPVSQIQHMCQCAQLAEENGADDDLILAAFLHDIGHLYEFTLSQKNQQQMNGFGIVDHEKIGAEFLLSKGVSKKIANLVQSHVAAKRYLTYKYPEYFNNLSDASKKTLTFQGGIMTKEEAQAFEKEQWFEDYIALRKWDEQAKNIQQPLPNLQDYKSLLTEHLAIQLS